MCIQQAGSDSWIKVGKSRWRSEERNTGNPPGSKGKGSVPEKRHKESTNDPEPGFAMQGVQPEPLLKSSSGKEGAFQLIRNDRRDEQECQRGDGTDEPGFKHTDACTHQQRYPQIEKDSDHKRWNTKEEGSHP